MKKHSAQGLSQRIDARQNQHQQELQQLVQQESLTVVNELRLHWQTELNTTLRDTEKILKRFQAQARNWSPSTWLLVGLLVMHLASLGWCVWNNPPQPIQELILKQLGLEILDYGDQSVYLLQRPGTTTPILVPKEEYPDRIIIKIGE